MRAQVWVVAAAILIVPAQRASAAETFHGKLWLVSNAHGLPATFPPPSATPDATFTTDHLSFMMEAPSDPNVNNTVAGFLNSADAVRNLTFSGIQNPAVGGVVSVNTPVVEPETLNCNSSYGAYLQFRGDVMLAQGQRITITHDDGVSLKIDGVSIRGLSSGLGGPALADYFFFMGTTGQHTIDLIYANVCGDGLLSFSPAM